MFDYDMSDTSGVLFFHGKESGPFGSKYQSLNEFVPTISPDFEGLHLKDRLPIAKGWAKDDEDLILVASSYGGLLAAILYQELYENIFGIVFMAPAFNYAEARTVKTLPEHCVIIHGTKDTVVPIEASREASQRLGVTLIEVDDGHRLSESHDVMILEVAKMIAARDSKRAVQA